MRKTIFGCADFGGSTTDAPCFRRLSDGKLVIGASSDLSAHPEDFTQCTADEANRVNPHTLCDAADAGDGG